MFTRDSRKLALAGSVTGLAVLAYVMVNLVLMAAAHGIESGGEVYPYGDEDWLRYFLQAYFEDDGRPGMMLTGPSTARESLVLELFVDEFPTYRVFQGSLSAGSIEDVMLSLEYIERVHGAAALPEVLVLGFAPRFLANIPDRRPFGPSLDAYSPYFGTVGEPGSRSLRPKSRWEGTWSALRFLTQKQTSRYQTVFLYFLRPRIPEAFDAWVRDSNLATLVQKLPSFIEYRAIEILKPGPRTFIEQRLGPYKFRYNEVPVDVEGLESWVEAPASWWGDVFAWDPGADAAATRGRIAELVGFVRRHGIRMFVINLPERDLIQARFDPRYHAHYREILRSELQGWPFLDLRDALSDDEFYDAEHATRAGADRLTGIVIEFMRRQGLNSEGP